MVHNISGTILAGGASKRFGGITKAKIVIGGKQIIDRIIETIAGLFEEIIIVTNSPDEFKEYNNFKIVSDQFKGAGPLGGIHSALQASTKEAIFVFAGDMPLLNKEYIIRQIDFFYSNKFDILIPRVDQLIEPLHAIYNRSIIKSLEKYIAADHNNAVREFVKLRKAGYITFKESEETKNAFTNVNSPSDICIVEKTISSYHKGSQSALQTGPD